MLHFSEQVISWYQEVAHPAQKNLLNKEQQWEMADWALSAREDLAKEEAVDSVRFTDMGWF